MPRSIEDHMGKLGFCSVAAYRLWCYRCGLDTGLEKTAEQRRAELELFESQQPVALPDVSRDHDPRRAEWIERIFRGELQDETVTDVLSRIRRIYNALEGDAAAREALERLALHTEKYSRFYRPARAHRRFSETMSNTCIAALGQLARHHRDWIRPVEDWRPDSRQAWRQFSDLARHLLARYHVPIVMDSAWFAGDTPEAHQEQEWFKHIGMGQNIRTAGVPTRITKRAAHLFLQESGRHQTTLQAVRRVQITAMGGARSLADTVGWSSLGREFGNEEFWESVMHFFVNNHPMLSTTYVDPIVDYIRHQKYENQRIMQADGTVVEGPPPHPRFSMKGRSADKLLRQVDNWHAELSGLENIPLKTWPLCGFKGLALQEEDGEIKRQVEWSVVELLTSAQLGVEGRLMHHCVGSYTDRCAAGEKSVWSIRVVDLEAEEPDPMHVLTIALDPKKRVVNEARGKYNLRPFDHLPSGGKKRTAGLYRHFLRESARIQRLWMDQVGLSHA